MEYDPEFLIEAANCAANRGDMHSLRRCLRSESSSLKWATSIPLHGAAAKNYMEVMYLLVEDVRVDVNKENASGDTAIHQCAVWGRLEAMVFLLSRGARPDGRNNKGETPLMICRARAARLLRSDDQAEALLALEMEEVLAATSQSGYRTWALQNLDNPYVKKYSAALCATARKQELVRLRELTYQRRAVDDGASDASIVFEPSLPCAVFRVILGYLD